MIAASAGAFSSRPPPFIRLMRSAVERADFTLGDVAWRAVMDLFFACRTSPAQHAALERAAPEFGRREMLLSVDEMGTPARLDSSIVTGCEEGARRHQELAGWLQVVPGEDGANPCLLIARWLCHAAGLRHRTVHLFLDLSGIGGCTLAQVRGLNRPEAPGLFDMPVAGHVAGLTPPRQAIVAELKEELGLEPEDLADLEPVGAYGHLDPADALPFRNAEHRTVFRARLRPGALERIRFTDGEVAAVAVFASPELEALVRERPAQVASGLAGSWPLYSR